MQKALASPTFLFQTSSTEMMTSDINVEEDVWALGNRPRLDAAVKASRYNLEDGTADGAAADGIWAAYLPGNPPQIILSARYLQEDEGFPPLEEHLHRLAPRSLVECLFALDSYRQCRILGEPLPGPGGYDFTADPVVDEVLASSQGILLWQFQLERLAQSLGLARQGAIRLRRGVNQKRPSALDPVEGKTFPSELALRDVIGERLLYDGTVPGEWKGARILFDAHFDN